MVEIAITDPPDRIFLAQFAHHPVEFIITLVDYTYDLVNFRRIYDLVDIFSIFCALKEVEQSGEVNAF